jgi:hypothetical protein
VWPQASQKKKKQIAIFQKHSGERRLLLLALLFSIYSKMSDAKAGATGGDSTDDKGGGDSEAKGGAGDRAEAKGGGREMDTECSDSDYSGSSGDPRDVQDIKAREVCIVKRSDGSWKYGTLRQWYVVVESGVEFSV